MSRIVIKNGHLVNPLFNGFIKYISGYKFPAKTQYWLNRIQKEMSVLHQDFISSIKDHIENGKIKDIDNDDFRKVAEIDLEMNFEKLNVPEKWIEECPYPAELQPYAELVFDFDSVFGSGSSNSEG